MLPFVRLRGLSISSGYPVVSFPVPVCRTPSLNPPFLSNTPFCHIWQAMVGGEVSLEVDHKRGVVVIRGRPAAVEEGRKEFQDKLASLFPGDFLSVRHDPSMDPSTYRSIHRSIHRPIDR